MAVWWSFTMTAAAKSYGSGEVFQTFSALQHLGPSATVRSSAPRLGTLTIGCEVEWPRRRGRWFRSGLPSSPSGPARTGEITDNGLVDTLL
ncbi:uncharacterized protein K489DRAFT_47160 [Dissoconium aciculare CBS 342.82]|uniref:Uncharacterized protein n=1 Tax=Dissoconium aciculare CBS 342.82 TaxID=1314786 RepID=A0A6J3LWH3_9PEZI|nr:uncharacterized protein K489DRAFT_47160 [Dissoconium aciculare CBS 342.82]KAF1820116.1 hypothetical protein K489DRAFT_47160 [Dissoconium aciculare CBS 342.82]